MLALCVCPLSPVLLLTTSSNHHWAASLEGGLTHPQYNCLVATEPKKEQEEQVSLPEEWLTLVLSFYLGGRTHCRHVKWKERHFMNQILL